MPLVVDNGIVVAVDIGIALGAAFRMSFAVAAHQNIVASITADEIVTVAAIQIIAAVAAVEVVVAAHAVTVSSPRPLLRRLRPSLPVRMLLLLLPAAKILAEPVKVTFSTWVAAVGKCC